MQQSGFAGRIKLVGLHQRGQRLALLLAVAPCLLQQGLAEREPVCGAGLRRGGPCAQLRQGVAGHGAIRVHHQGRSGRDAKTRETRLLVTEGN